MLFITYYALFYAQYLFWLYGLILLVNILAHVLSYINTLCHKLFLFLAQYCQLKY